MDVVISNVSKVYKGRVAALISINLTISKGMFGLLGPNGAGKSTLIRLLAGILQPTSGTIEIGGMNISSERNRAALKEHLGYLPQDVGMYPDLCVYEFLDYMAILKSLTDYKSRQRRIKELLEWLNLTEVSSRKIKALSGGMKRRVGIAQALLNDPKLLIVDEPTAGLDPEERIRFRNLLTDLARNRTVLLSTHIVEDIARVCNYIVVMKEGRIAFCGSTSELIQTAEGKVWNITTDGTHPGGDIYVVSTSDIGSGVQYRVVGKPSMNDRAVQAEPALEDGYIWIAKQPN